MTRKIVNQSIRDLCLEKTSLTSTEIDEIIKVACQLQNMADLYGSDVFIDCLIRGRTDLAVVVAQAKPQTARSLYSEYIVGQLILKDNEPGVFYSFSTGKYIPGTRAITNDNVTTEQKVLPIKVAEKVIGVLILEQDISRQVIQEETARLFQQTAEDLGQTLWEVAVAETNLPSLIHEGVILCNAERLFTYVNPTAHQWFEKLNKPGPQIGLPLHSVLSGAFDELFSDACERGVEAREFTFGQRTVLVKAISIRRGKELKGGLLLLSDITDLRQKERQLMIKSAVIKEIHHRVKNNLQTISSLLRIQMRRTKSEDIRGAFQDSIHRIKTIALVHETLSRSGLDLIELNGMIERIVSMLLQSALDSETQIEFQLQGDSAVLPSEKATAVALVLNELVQNCLDHAFTTGQSGCIKVHVSRGAEELKIVVEDDGSGFDPQKIANDTLGTQIVRALVEEDLEGRIWYETGLGTKVSLSFPYTADNTESE